MKVEALSFLLEKTRRNKMAKVVSHVWLLYCEHFLLSMVKYAIRSIVMLSTHLKKQDKKTFSFIHCQSHDNASFFSHFFFAHHQMMCPSVFKILFSVQRLSISAFFSYLVHCRRLVKLGLS
jgi:hypothetical protein